MRRCIDALMHKGIVTTTAMGGAATALDKTDWSPLAGKTVIVWPDHDEAGTRYANVVVPNLLGIGARVRRIEVPDDKPQKWDAADAMAEGIDVHALLASAMPVANIHPRQPFDITQWRAYERFTGDPQPRRWLIEGVFPMAQAALVAAGGGVGKSFLLLALAREVPAFDGVWANAPTLFGGALAGQGVAIYVTAEDDAIEVHNRLNALGPIPDRLYVLPLPDTGGLVDGVRSVYALWNPKEDQAKGICKTLGEPFERGRVVMGGVVKANGRANLRVTTFLRDSRGLLMDRSDAQIRARQTDVDLLPDLKAAIARAAAEGKPYTKTGGNGVYERRHELPEAFHAIGKHRLADWVGTLLEREELVMAMIDGSKVMKWLDLPDGPMASGEAAFVTGHLKRSSPAQHDQP